MPPCAILFAVAEDVENQEDSEPVTVTAAQHAVPATRPMAPSSRGWSQNGSLRISVMLLSALMLLAALRFAGDFLVPVLLGILLAIVNYPIMRMLEIRRVARGLAAFVTVGINIWLLGFMFYLGTSAIAAFQEDRARYFQGLSTLAKRSAEWAESKGVKGAVERVNNALDDRNEFVRYVIEADLTSNLGNTLASFSTEVVGRVTGLISTGFFVLIVMVFALFEGRNIGAKIERIRDSRGPDFSGFLRSADDIQRYLRIKTLASVVTGLLAGLLCHVCGLDYAFLWGLLAFVLNFIPVVGSILAGVLPVIIALLQGPWIALAVMGGYLAINTGIGNLLEPMFLGRRFGVSTLVIIISVFFWGWMWGPMGMFLAVPLTMVVKVIFDNSDDFRWLSVAMGKGDVDEERILAEQQAADERRRQRRLQD